MDSVEEVLVESVELAQRAVDAVEKANRAVGIDFHDEEGNFVRHIDFKRDPEPARQALKIAQDRLDTYRNSLV